MSVLRSSTSESEKRGQTEPLAALVAVTFLAIGLAMYGNVITEAVPGTSDEALDQVTIDRVWHEVSVDGRYNESKTDLTDLEPGTFPQGKVVYVNVTYQRSDGTTAVVSEAQFDRSGDPMTVDPAADANVASRPIPVSVPSDPVGRVRSGRLTVGVWD